jgi:hypothetical protein
MLIETFSSDTDAVSVTEIGAVTLCWGSLTQLSSIAFRVPRSAELGDGRRRLAARVHECRLAVGPNCRKGSFVIAFEALGVSH